MLSRLPIPFAKSLLGQVMLVVAFGLLVGQAVSAVLLYQAAEQRREAGLVNAIAFRLVAAEQNRGQRRIARRSERRAQRDAIFAERGANPTAQGDRRWRRFGLQRADAFTPLPTDITNPALEQNVANVLTEQLFDFQQVQVVERRAGDDPFVVALAKERARMRQPAWKDRTVLVAGVELPNDQGWMIARVAEPPRPAAIAQPVILQTLVIFVILFALLYIVLRRITRPVARLTSRVDAFALNPDKAVPIDEAGPQDIRQLIAAHNAMEAHIASMLDEKDVMLGAIGHDLKTPLAALRVRIESVKDDAQRSRMAESIEDITHTLDDILSLARVGRNIEEPERTNLTALAASVVDEFDDLGELVELADAPRIVGTVHATWVKRALRNLISNAVRYGQDTKVSLMDDDGEAVIVIQDSGPGIPEDRIAAMLEPFARGENSRNRATGGAGLGLTLARAIADQHGGSLTLSNRAEGGLRAEFRLPLAGIDQAA